MDGAKKTLLVSVIAALITGATAANAGMISIPNFNQLIPMPAPSPAPAPGANMAIPSLPNGTQIPTTTQPPSGVSALPQIATSGQTTTPIYGVTVQSTDSTGSSGTAQTLSSSCASSGGDWNAATNSCSTASGASYASQCQAMGGTYANGQCSMPIAGNQTPPAFNPYGWAIGWHGYSNQGINVLPSGEIDVYNNGQLVYRTSTAVSAIYMASIGAGLNGYTYATIDKQAAEQFANNAYCYQGQVMTWSPGGRVSALAGNYGYPCN